MNAELGLPNLLIPPLDEQQAPSQPSLTHETAKIDTLVAKEAFAA